MLRDTDVIQHPEVKEVNSTWAWRKARQIRENLMKKVASWTEHVDPSGCGARVFPVKGIV